MRGFVRLCAIVGMVVVCMTGCQSYREMLDNHEAVQMQNDGIWEERYSSLRFDDSEQEGCTLRLSVNVRKDMTEEQMLVVLDYCELWYNAFLDLENNKEMTRERDSDFTCYAVFYQGDTDEVIRKFKYVNHESVEITEEDNYGFAPSYFVSPH